MLTIKHNIHRRTFGSNTKNTNTKRNNRRRHSNIPILSHNLCRIASTMAATWIIQLHTSYIKSNNKHADDLPIITKILTSLQNQVNKLDTYRERARLDFGIPKCALPGCPDTSMMNQETVKVQIQATHITCRNLALPIAHQNEPYVSQWGQIFSFCIPLSLRKDRCSFLNFGSHRFSLICSPVLLKC